MLWRGRHLPHRRRPSHPAVAAGALPAVGALSTLVDDTPTLRGGSRRAAADGPGATNDGRQGVYNLYTSVTPRPRHIGYRW